MAVLSKEFAVGALNGMLWALVMGAIVSLWFGDWTIALSYRPCDGHQPYGRRSCRHLATGNVARNKYRSSTGRLGYSHNRHRYRRFCLFSWTGHGVLYLMTIENNEFEDEELISKSQLKRDSQALQDMGSQLVEMPVGQLAKFDLPENLKDAIYEARRLKNREGKRRQLQYIGKLMRTARYQFYPGNAGENGSPVPDLSTAFSSSWKTGATE